MAIKEDLYFSAQHIIDGQLDLTIPGQVVADLSLWIERVGISLMQGKGNRRVTIRKGSRTTPGRRALNRISDCYLKKKEAPRYVREGFP